MRIQKGVFRRNRRGNVSFVACEQYLRDDLSTGLEEGGALCASQPVLVLSLSVLEEQTDLLRDGGFPNCVLPSSALALLEERGERATANELRALCAAASSAAHANDGRQHHHRMTVFHDVHHVAVHTARVQGESREQQARRQAEAVASFYASHHPHLQHLRVLVVTDAEQYALAHAPHLLQRVAWKEPDREPRLFAPFLSKTQIDEGLEDGSLREGRFYDTCVDVVTGEEIHLTDRNRALPGDRVAIDSAGRVVGILARRARRLLVGTAIGAVFVAQDGSRVLLRAPAPPSRRLIAVVDCWPIHRETPLGHIARDLGELHESGAEQEGVLASFEVRSEPFSAAQLAELPPASVVPGLTPGREDLRALPICSVDPPGCTDIDDALHARSLPGGLFEVGVHIADVSFYVAEDSLLDMEARERSTTVYLVDRRIDMLPERLSGHLCSLVSTADRHAMSVIWTLDNQARIVSTRFCRSLIRSRASLTYAAAQALIDDKSKNDDVVQSLRLLQRLAKILKDGRVSRGALLLSSPEVKFVNRDNNGTDVLDVEMYQSLESNSTVEEFMLLANICVANKIWSSFPSLAMLRRHAPPDPAKWNLLLKHLSAVGVHPKSTANADVAAALENAPEMARVLVTRFMQQAVYLCSSSVSGVESFAHYGLAVPIYTHFTSPIRRYADVVVHRLLAAAIGVGPVPRLDGRQCERVARHINHKHRMAQLAGRASAEVHSKKVLREGAREADGSVLAFLADGRARVLVPTLGLEVLVTLPEPVPVLGLVRMKLSIAPGEDLVHATVIQASEKRQRK